MPDTIQDEHLYVEPEHYHAHPANGSSDIKLAYRDIYAYREKQMGRAPQTEPTPAMTLGSVFDLMLTEPDAFDERFVVLEKGARKPKDEKREVIRDQGQYSIATVNAMLEEIHKHKVARAVLDLGATRCQTQASYFATVKGVQAKCRPDVLHRNYCVDIKTTADASPTAFARQAIRLGYHIQQEWYTRILQQNKRVVERFYFVVVQTSWPFTVGVYTLPATALVYADVCIQKACNKIIRGHEKNDWLNQTHREVIELDCPDYVFNFEEC